MHRKEMIMPREQNPTPMSFAGVEMAEEQPMTLQRVAAAAPAADDDWPNRGGLPHDKAGRAEEQVKNLSEIPVTRRELFVLARRDTPRRTPVFRASGGEKAVAVFTDRDHAVFYLQVAGWGDFEPVGLSPLDLGDWLKQARDDGVTLVVVDPNRRAQLNGEPQPALSLEGRTDFSGDALYGALRAVREQPTL
jgi:hypothetical protein